MIPHSKPLLDKSDYDEVLRVLSSGFISQGREVEKFEASLSDLIGVKAGVAVNSGTAALHLSLAALGIGSGDEIILPSYTCSALLNAVRYVGADPVLADIDLSTYNMDPGNLRKLLTARTKAIIVPHMFGLAADMDEFLAAGLPVIEDCALSVGSHYRSRLTGSMGLLSVFSFYATKLFTTGEGGMVLSNDAALIERIRDLRDYDGKKGRWITRYNYKMTDFQAALGRNQLQKLPFFIGRRQEIAALYNEVVTQAGLSPVYVPEDRDHVYYRYILPETPRGCREVMEKNLIECRKPVFEPLHRYLGLDGYACSEKAWENALSIPIYPALKPDEVEQIVDVLKTLLQ